MQIVIDIPKYVYDTIIACDGYIGDCDNEKVGNAIKKGTILPKGHGDLIDRDSVNSRYDGIYVELDSLSNKPTYKELLDKWSMCLDTEIPVVKADDEGGERNDTDKRFDKENDRFFHWRRILRKR